jgi:hypothetical protein
MQCDGLQNRDCTAAIPTVVVPLFVVNDGASRAPALPMADTFPPTIAPQSDSSENATEQSQQPPDAPESVPITEQEVGEYREQDRYLPVSPQAPLPRETRKRARASPFALPTISFRPLPLPAGERRLQMCRVS